MLFSDLRKTPGRRDQVAAVLEGFSLLTQDSLKTRRLESISDVLRSLGSGNGEPQSNRLLKKILVAKRCFKPEQGHAEVWIHLKSLPCLKDRFVVAACPIQRTSQVGI